ncbi:MAG TPA: hypothetical protein VL017_12700 [Devosia sp.]|nr:hypothetical protein [Devosia sp.]
MVAMAPLRYARREINCGITLEADRQNAARARRGAGLEQIGGPLRQQFGLAGAGARDNGAIVPGSHDIERVRFKCGDTDRLPLIWANPPRQDCHR